MLKTVPSLQMVIIKTSFASELFGTQKGLFSRRDSVVLGDQAPRHVYFPMQLQYSLFEVNNQDRDVPGHRLHKIEKIRLNHVYCELLVSEGKHI